MPRGSWVIGQNIILTVLIHNLKTARPTKIPMPFLNSLDNLLWDVCIIFFKKVLIILRESTKHANFWLRGAVPLKNGNSCYLVSKTQKTKNVTKLLPFEPKIDQTFWEFPYMSSLTLQPKQRINFWDRKFPKTNVAKILGFPGLL